MLSHFYVYEINHLHYLSVFKDCSLELLQGILTELEASQYLKASLLRFVISIINICILFNPDSPVTGRNKAF